MSLCGKIINIPVSSDFDYADFTNKVHAYKSGHRDARYVAADLTLDYDQLIEDIIWILEDVPQGLISGVSYAYISRTEQAIHILKSFKEGKYK